MISLRVLRCDLEYREFNVAEAAAVLCCGPRVVTGSQFVDEQHENNQAATEGDFQQS